MFDTIINNIITDKSNGLKLLNKYTISVRKKIGKNKLKEEITKLLNIMIDKVNIMHYKPRTRIIKGKIGKNKGFKKAIISI